MDIKRITGALLGSALLTAATSAYADFTEYFGEDLSPGFTVPPSGNSEDARTNFLDGLSGGVGNEDFEGFALGTGAPLNISFPGSTGSITATITGNGCVEASAGGGCTGSNSFGRFNTSPGGDQWWEATDQFTIDFDSPIAAFGFYATDIGDFSGQVTLTATNGIVKNLVIPNTVNGPNGSLLFYGFIDTDNSYVSISFGNTAAGTDFFGFDDMVIGDPAQVIKTVAIDIKPGSDPNCFNINGHGVIPVAVLGDEDFDVTEIDLTSLSFGGLEVRVRGNKGPQCSVEDSNGDGYPDLVCHFEDNSEIWEPGDDEATLTGNLLDGQAIEGSDSICIRP